VAYNYSQCGYGILQLVIEEVTGIDYAAYMQAEILTPLGMDQSGFGWSEALEEKAAVPYATGSTGIGNTSLPHYYAAIQAASGLYTTVSDLSAFMAALLPTAEGELPGRGVLQPESVEMMLSPQEATDGGSGLGFWIDGLAGKHWAYHEGFRQGWWAAFYALPEEGAGIVILTNDENDGDDFGWAIDEIWAPWAAGIPAP
jgi:CubicO group peptidase (beta-lactamase class C family)